MTKVADSLAQIKEKIKLNEYAFSSHAEQEIQEDLLNETEVEDAIISSRVIRTQIDKLKRTVYTLEGTTRNFRQIGIICRFSDSGKYVIIITVYEII